jgi:hypothetical protein
LRGRDDILAPEVFHHFVFAQRKSGHDEPLCDLDRQPARRPVGVRRISAGNLGLGGLRSVFRYSDTWQLIINTGTTVLTFLAVFLIQNTQNRDSVALHLKLDELIRVTAARNEMMAIETKTETEVAAARAGMTP